MKSAEGRAVSATSQSGYSLRDTMGEQDLDAIVSLHAAVYGPEYGFDDSFAAYVREPLARFLKETSPRGRLWIAEGNGVIAGCIALVEVSHHEAQLRWYVVGKDHRGQGLGTRLMAECLGFVEEQGYRSVFLWTVNLLPAAARVYARAGFTVTDSIPRNMWGRDLVEQKMNLNFRP